MRNPERPKTGSKASGRSPFEISGVSAPAGKLTEVELHVARLPTGVWMSRIDPAGLSGTVLAVPAVNVFGLIQESRYLPDRRDLNRCFPGSKRGSSAAQLAHLFMSEIVGRCELGLDLHTGSGGRTNLPQLRCDLDEPGTLRLAREFGAPVLVHARVRDGSLRAAARELDKIVLV